MMKKIGIAVVVCVLLLIGISVIVPSHTIAPSKPTPTPTSILQQEAVFSPEQTVENFYAWYLAYEGNPLSENAYAKRPELSTDIKQKIASTMASFTGGGYDPILCAQDKPSQIAVGPATISGNTATVHVEQTFGTGKRLLPVTLVKHANTWEIQEISCTKTVPQQGLGTRTVVVYFSNTKKAGSDTDCSIMYPVSRTIPATYNIAGETLYALFAGPTDAEKAEGYTSFFSSQTKDILVSLKIVHNVAYVNLTDIRATIPNASTSCGSSQFFSSIDQTLKQFNSVDSVVYAINGDPKAFYEWMQIGCTKTNNICDSSPFR